MGDSNIIILRNKASYYLFDYLLKNLNVPYMFAFVVYHEFLQKNKNSILSRRMHQLNDL